MVLYNLERDGIFNESYYRKRLYRLLLSTLEAKNNGQNNLCNYYLNQFSAILYSQFYKKNNNPLLFPNNLLNVFLKNYIDNPSEVKCIYKK